MDIGIEIEKRTISVKHFLDDAPEELKLEIIVGDEGASIRHITSSRILEKLGLAIAGFSHYIHRGRVQIVGQSEITYLAQLDPAKRRDAIRNLELENVSCVLLTKNLEPPAEMIEIARESGLPLLRTHLISSVAITKVTTYLEDVLAPQMTIHGVLLGVYGLGILIRGDSGIGKSECALDLITRGHRLISDDSVVIKRIGEDLEGASPALTHEHLEIRGLGIINVKDLFGISAVGDKIRIDLCIELKRWNQVEGMDRLGLDTQREMIFGIGIPKFMLPVSSGRNLATLIETAIRLHLSRKTGSDTTALLIERHAKMIGADKKN